MANVNVSTNAIVLYHLQLYAKDLPSAKRRGKFRDEPCVDEDSEYHLNSVKMIGHQHCDTWFV